MPNQLSFQFEYSAREQVRALEETPYRRLVRKWWVPGGVGLITAIFAWHAIRNDWYARTPSALFWVGAVGVLPMLVMIVVTPIIIRRFEILRYRRTRTAISSAPETRQFGVEGLSHGNGTPSIPWSMITRVVETENFYLFYNALSDNPDYLPKRVLAPADAKALHELLDMAFQSRSHSLQLLPRTT